MKVLIEEKNVKQVISDFDAIEKAIENCGVDVPKGTDTKDYAGKILEVEDRALNIGRGEGYESGYTEGETAGYNKGYDKGYADGSEEASLAGEAITITDKGDIAALPDTAEVGEVYSLPTEQDQHYIWNGQEWVAVGDTRDINPEWTDWRYFSCHDNRNSLVAKLKYSDTSNGIRFDYMFYYCKELTSIPAIDTSNGTIFSSMFFGCTALTSVPQLDTSNGTDFGNMFRQCSSLTSIPAIDTSNGTGFNYMFYGCTGLTSIPALDTSKCYNFQYTFCNCTALTSIPQLDLTKAASSTYVSSTFQNCGALVDLNIIGTIKTTGLDVKNSSLLSHDSLMSIINALADKTSDTSGTTWKVTLGSTNKAKLTADELAIAENKGWTVA